MKKQNSCRKTPRVLTSRVSPCSRCDANSNREELPFPRVRSRSAAGNFPENFNRYYIHPSLRYRNRIDNPKDVSENYND